MSSDFEICIKVECLECGESLTVEYSEETLHVEPCSHCIDGAYEYGEEARKDSMDDMIRELEEKISDLESKIEALEEDSE